jgi:hypothetical protein
MISRWIKAIEQNVIVAHRDVFRAFNGMFMNGLPPPHAIC